MNILITGICGFIGSHLARRLVKKSWTVYGVDNLSYGFIENIKDLTAKNNFHFFEIDVTDPSIIKKFENENLDFVVHFACTKSPRYGKRMEALETNSLGTQNLLEIVRLSQARFIYGSTGEIYGKNPEIPFTEEATFQLGKPEIRRWSGVVSQMYSEHLCFAYHEKYKIDFSIVRFFNIYGPGQSMDWRGGPQAIFIKAALANEPMEIHGDGVQSRDLTFIDDAIDGVLLALENPYASGQVVNIGSEKKISIVNLAYMVWRLMENPEKPKLKFLAYNDFPHLYEDIRHRNCDTTKAHCLLGFKAETSLEEGMKKTIEWYRLRSRSKNS
tara:strand:+ start:680 stop:1663 length:984 start_codon:yes stop_codon:yes gene_type:complete